MASLPSMDLRALVTLWNVTQQHIGTSGARVCAQVLLGLYNGPRFPLDMTELRLLDGDLLRAALIVISCDSTRCEREIHDWLNVVTGRHDFGPRLEHLAHQYRLKGRCKRDQLDPISPARLMISAAKEQQPCISN